MPQLTFTTSNQSLLKNNLYSLYELVFSFFLLFMQLWLLISTFYTEIFFQPILVTQLLQNTSPQIANGLQTLIVFSILMTESIYHLLVISAYMFSSIIMITFLLATLVRTKHQNLFTTDIPGPVSMLVYNNSTSPTLFICDLNYNVTSLMDLLSNFLFLNNYVTLFL